ncbi:carboxypeptidase regulatory-like domain-containing protein [Brevifollis gellanilyticus]|uniref:SD-repeat containing protein B domain-containing protein n=1 Tax=Brevifollis gellanilyticus TaxID=748831 RepID=A0A512M906_9BACT|nr:carboxypeptidase regulatory-like domain-containing protein [Brevifollis gellanilyticus]GEP42841.1 hypothetical protein BGE01nite_21320 [Brevifollis gellanilyticus]
MKTHLLLLHLLLLGFVVPSIAAPLPAVHGRVYGQDEKGNNLGPLPGAKIELLSGKGNTVVATVTASSPGGYYQIKDLPPADYAYRVTSAGFKTEDARRGFKVPQNSLEYVHDFILTKPPAKRERCDVPVLVVKRVRTGDKPDESVRLQVAGARMHLRPTSPKITAPPNQPFVSNDKGDLLLKDLAVGDYEVSIDAPETQTFIGSLKVACGTRDQIVFELQPCDEVLHSLVRVLLRDGWGTSAPAKTAAARASQSITKLAGKDNGAASYARGLSQIGAGSYEGALGSLAESVNARPEGVILDRAAETRLWMLLLQHQPSLAIKEARSLARIHYGNRAVTPASRDTAQSFGLALGMMLGPWKPDVGTTEAAALERDLLDALRGELRQEAERERDRVLAEFARLNTSAQGMRNKVLADADTRRKEDVSRIEARQATIEREVKALDADIQRLQGMTQVDQQLRVQLAGFAQQRQAIAVQMRQLQARLQQLSLMINQGGGSGEGVRPMFPPNQQQRLPQRGVPQRGNNPTFDPQQPPQQPAQPQINPRVQMEMQQIQAQIAGLQQQDAQLATSMVNLQNKAQRTSGAAEAELDGKKKRRDDLARESEVLDQQRVAPFDPNKATTPEISALDRRARLVKTYRDFPLDKRRQELLDQFTCGASKDKPGPTNDASKPVQIIEKDFPSPRQSAR